MRKFAAVLAVLFLCGQAFAGKSYSSGGKSYSSPSKPSSSSYSKPSGSSYSKPATQSYSKKPTESFQSSAADEQKKTESRAAYRVATYTTPKGETKKIDPTDKKVEQVRKEYAADGSKWATRTDREKVIYRDYYSRPAPPITYNDPISYNPFFWMWLMDRGTNERATWVYNHRDDMDSQRYKDMLAKDSALEARVKQLEAEKTEKNPDYVPPGLDPDLQYDDSFVAAVANPEPSVSWHELWVVVQWIFGIVVVLVSLGFLYWLVFEKRW